MLLERWLPEFDVSRRYDIGIRARSERIFEAVRGLRVGDSFVTRALMGVRGYRVAEGGSLDESLVRFGFTRLDEDPGRELVYGIVGKFWHLDGGLCALERDEFAGFREDGFAKGVWNFLVTDSGLSTETRVRCYGDDARRKFLRYWRLIEPFSGLIRRSLLRAVRRAATSSPRR